MKLRTLPTSRATRFLVLVGLLAFAAEVWQLWRTVELQEAMLAKSLPHATVRAQLETGRKPAAQMPVALETTAESASPGHPLNLADGTVITVTTSTPPAIRTITVHRPAGVPMILAMINGELSEMSLADFCASPEFMAQLDLIGRTAIKYSYDDYLKQSGWMADQQELFLTKMSHLYGQLYILTMQFDFNDDHSAAGIGAVNQQADKLEQATEAGLRGLYASEADFAAFQEARRQFLGISLKNALNNSLRPPLDAGQASLVVRAVTEVYAESSLPPPMVLFFGGGGQKDFEAQLAPAERQLQERLANAFTPAQSIYIKEHYGFGLLSQAMMEGFEEFNPLDQEAGVDVRWCYFPSEVPGGTRSFTVGASGNGRNGRVRSDDYAVINVITDKAPGK